MEKTRVKSLIRVLVVITFLGMITVNILANVIPINGVTTGEVSDDYPNLFAPAPYTFAIWGLIYLLLACYTLYQLGIFRKLGVALNSGLINKVGIWFSVSSLANILWIFAWHYGRISLSVLFMLVILICLILIAGIIGKEKLTLSEKLLIRLPFFVYFGWITVAAIANITVWLVSIGWNGFGLSEAAWTVIVLLVGAVIGILVMLDSRDISYGLVLIWAYIGILVQHVSPNGWDMKYPAVIYTDVLCVVLFAGVLVYNIIKNIKAKRNGGQISGI